MAIIHPETMPQEYQDEILADFDFYYAGTFESDIKYLNSNARAWFNEQVQLISGISDEDKIARAVRYIKVGGSNSNNTEIHVDYTSRKNLTKYILTICDFPSSSTLFFPNAEASDYMSDYEIASTSLFRRDRETKLLVPKKHRHDDLRHVMQGVNGQIAEFEYGIDVHAAAPLPAGAKKILLFNVTIT